MGGAEGEARDEMGQRAKVGGGGVGGAGGEEG